MIETLVTLTVPETGDDITLRVTATCIARATSGYFDHVSGAGEPPSGNEFDDYSFEVEWPEGSDRWHAAPKWMTDIILEDRDNQRRLDAGLDEALREADEDEYDRYIDAKIDEAKERRHGL